MEQRSQSVLANELQYSLLLSLCVCVQWNFTERNFH